MTYSRAQCSSLTSSDLHLAAVTITGDWAANLGLCSALRAFKQGGIFIVPHLL